MLYERWNVHADKSLTPGECGSHFKRVISEYLLWVILRTDISLIRVNIFMDEHLHKDNTRVSCQCPSYHGLPQTTDRVTTWISEHIWNEII